MATLSFYTLTLLIIILCYKEKQWTNILLTWITALSIREVVDVVNTLITIASGTNPRSTLITVSDNTYINSLVYDCIHIITLAFLYFCFRKRIKTIKSSAISAKIIIISLLMLLALVIVKTFVIINSNYDMNLYTCCVALIGLISLMLLLIRSDILKESNYVIDRRIMRHVLASNQAQYEALKTNIDVINMKAHDMKHQLEKYQDKLTQEEVETIQKAIEVYDKNINTGNQVLDTVLYSESLICDKNNIRFTYLCDGKNLDKFSSSQLYYLFSNIIDNAIEATREVEGENRIISFNIKCKNNQIVIDECNYFKGERNIQNGLIKTTKKDQRRHGYGMKSIQMIVKDNNGTMNIHTEGNMFFLIINLPIPLEVTTPGGDEPQISEQIMKDVLTENL
ncbi:MAG: ATP-binding protein [Bacilli bacterium]|nr:ATP-binding protein [Bacilli bacterium]